MKVDPDLLQVGDVVYMTRRVGVGNTTLKTTNIYDVRIVSIERQDGRVKRAEVVWNGCNHDKWYRHELEHLHATHPKPAYQPFWGGSDKEYHARKVEEAKIKAKEESKIWRERKKALVAK